MITCTKAFYFQICLLFVCFSWNHFTNFTASYTYDDSCQFQCQFGFRTKFTPFTNRTSDMTQNSLRMTFCEICTKYIYNSMHSHPEHVIKLVSVRRFVQVQMCTVCSINSNYIDSNSLEENTRKTTIGPLISHYPF